MAAAEGQTRGRKRRREKSVNPDDYASDEDMKGDQEEMKSQAKRNMTPAQRSISVKSTIRSKSKGRLEGSVPKRLPYKLVPEEQIRLAKKINKAFRTTVNISESDRIIQTKKPKHLFAGKMSNGTRNKR